MGKRYIFLVTCILLGVTIVYFGRVGTSENTERIDQDIIDIKVGSDSTLIYAEEVLDNVIEQKVEVTKKIESLDDLVQDKELTIEEKMVEVRRLLKQANDFKDLAEANAKRAREVGEMATLQQMEAEKAKMESLKQLNIVLEKNKKLSDRVLELEEIINGIMNLSVDPSIIDEPSKEKKKNKKGKNNN